MQTPLIKGFQSTTIFKAFVLNALVSTLIIFMATTIRKYYDDLTHKDKNNTTNLLKTLLFTFITAISSYMLLYVIFGFGQGMLI